MCGLAQTDSQLLTRITFSIFFELCSQTAAQSVSPWNWGNIDTKKLMRRTCAGVACHQLSDLPISRIRTSPLDVALDWKDDTERSNTHFSATTKTTMKYAGNTNSNAYFLPRYSVSSPTSHNDYIHISYFVGYLNLLPGAESILRNF